MSRLDDPQFRHDRAKKARAAQGLTVEERIDWHLRSVESAAPRLTSEQRARLAAALRSSAEEVSAA